ncbi:MAG: lytic murein transglycosylase [Bauldia sp.]
MPVISRRVRAFGLAIVFLAAAGPALAAKCGNGPAGFPTWLAAFKKEAAAAGISAGVVNSALNGVSYNAGVVALDRRQGHFKKSFAAFSATRITPGAIARGRSLLKQQASLLAKIEKRFGVQPEVIVAIWGLETGYGGGMGNTPSIRSLATLAYDCRRTAFFTEQLMDALKVIQRGDLSAAEMKGAWAGEVGQTQFMASSYLKFGIDFDGDGRANLRSVADALASTANYLKGYGWAAGQPYGEGSANFAVFAEWNKASVYQKTIAAFAQRLAGG